jgi:hypothetical protein
MDRDTLRRTSRRLRDLVELLAANVYFAPEAQAAYGELGLDYGSGYFCSRGGCMGQVPGEVVVAAFGVFNPELVVPAVGRGWEKATVDQVLSARHRGATESLARILGGVPDGVGRATELLRRAADAGTGEGRPLFSGLRSLGFPGDPLGDLWRAADLVREHRGDTHTVAWVGAGVGAAEITLLTELWWGIPHNSYVVTRGWSTEQIGAAVVSLEERGLIADGAFTAQGERLRTDIEDATDQGERKLVVALGSDADELFGIIEPWGEAVLAGGGYPADPRTMTRY